jgi:hypothetical protein
MTSASAPAAALHPRAFIIDTHAPSTGRQAVRSDPSRQTWDSVRASGSVFLRLVFRSVDDWKPIDDASGDPLIAVIGSDLEWSLDKPANVMASAASVIRDAAAARLTVRTSIVGLPPIFLYRAGIRTIITSDLSLLCEQPGVDLAFDEVSLGHVCRIGHPIGYRTLFKGVTVVPGGVRIDVDRRGAVSMQTAWTMPVLPPLDWKDFTELQANLFRASVRRLDLKGAFLSLTGGLDSRTILAAMLEAGHSVPAYTMSWGNVSLDARLAAAVCRPYRIQHEVIGFDESFAAEVGERALTASRLSGGLAAVGEAIEVAFYERIGGPWRSRISGFLGNQIGRGGHEQVSLRRGHTDVLADTIRQNASDDEGGAPSMSLWAETLFASIGNYGIGHYFANQASPYASRRLLESLACRPTDDCRETGSTARRHMKDLRHRFVGEPVPRSFQRQLILSVGGHVADAPVNWGWRVAGGVSPPGLARGTLAFLDALASSRGLRLTRRRWVAGLPGLRGRHTIRQSRLWWSRDLLESVLLDQSIRESGLFDVPVLRRKLEEHFEGGHDRLRDLLLAADLAYAHRVFLGPEARLPRTHR